MPTNIPPLRNQVPLCGSNKDKDGLEKYYDYEVKDESEIKRELIHKRNEKISTVFCIASLILLVSGITTAVVAAKLESKPLSVISLILCMITFVSMVVGSNFNDDHYYDY